VGTIVALGLAFIHPIQRRDVFLFFGMLLLTGREFLSDIIARSLTGHSGL
jgi:hypothetical protein